MTTEEIKLHNQLVYLKIYDSIVLRAKSRGLIKKNLDYYTEKHHIYPKCLGGLDDEMNLVLLTYREHVICHKLLTKLSDDPKVFLAASLMLRTRLGDGNHKVATNSREAEEFRRIAIEKLKGRKVSQETLKKRSEGIRKAIKSMPAEEFKKKYVDSHKGIKKTEDWKNNLSKSLKGRKFSEKTRQKMSLAKLGSKRSDEAKRKTSETLIKNRLKNKSLKKVLDPNGVVHNSVKDCAAYWNVDPHTISRWIHHNSEKGFKLIIND